MAAGPSGAGDAKNLTGSKFGRVAVLRAALWRVAFVCYFSAALGDMPNLGNRSDLWKPFLRSISKVVQYLCGHGATRGPHFDPPPHTGPVELEPR